MSRIYATGRRKTATARVFMTPGSGKVTVNGLPADQYFGRAVHLLILNQAFDVTETLGNFDIVARCNGGGKSGRRHRVGGGRNDPDEVSGGGGGAVERANVFVGNEIGPRLGSRLYCYPKGF